MTKENTTAATPPFTNSHFPFTILPMGSSAFLCPDCAGVVGATQTTDDGPPCTCFTADTKSETAIDMPSPAEPAKPKICVLCGKDLTGHRRVKDSRGYVCYECAKAEQKAELGGRVRCRVCGRLVKEEALMKFEGAKMCDKCHLEKTKARKNEIKRIGIKKAHSRFEKSRLYLMLGAAGFLLLVIVLSKYHLLPSW